MSSLAFPRAVTLPRAAVMRSCGPLRNQPLGEPGWEWGGDTHPGRRKGLWESRPLCLRARNQASV